VQPLQGPRHERRSARKLKAGRLELASRRGLPPRRRRRRRGWPTDHLQLVDAVGRQRLNQMIADGRGRHCLHRDMGALKMHDLKMTYKENYGSGKCRTGKWRTKFQQTVSTITGMSSHLQRSVFRTSVATAALRTSVIITNYCWHIAYKECCKSGWSQTSRVRDGR